jgi:hypothetical protein
MNTKTPAVHNNPLAKGAGLPEAKPLFMVLMVINYCACTPQSLRTSIPSHNALQFVAPHTPNLLDLGLSQNTSVSIVKGNLYTEKPR